MLTVSVLAGGQGQKKTVDPGHLLDQRCTYELLKQNILFTMAVPWDPVHEYHKQDQRQGTTLAESNTHCTHMPDKVLGVWTQLSFWHMIAHSNKPNIPYSCCTHGSTPQGTKLLDVSKSTTDSIDWAISNAQPSKLTRVTRTVPPETEVWLSVRVSFLASLGMRYQGGWAV